MSLYLTGLVVLFIAAVATGTLVERHQESADSYRAAAADARFAARLGAAQLAADVAGLQGTIASVAEQPSIAQALTAPTGCGLTYSGTTLFPSGHLDIVTTLGVPACSSLPLSTSPAYADAGWLHDARRIPIVRAPVLDTRTGREVVVLASPIGAGGAVVAFLNLDAVGPALAATFGGPRGMEFVMTTGDTILTRSIDATRWVGQPLPARRLAGRDVDGRPRLYGAAVTGALGWHLAAGADRSAATAAVDRLTRRDLTLSGVWLAVFLLAALVIHRRITRPIAKLGVAVRAATGGGSGSSVVTRTGPAEVIGLAEDFSRLVASRDRELASATQLAATKDAVLASALDSVITANYDGEIVDANAAAAQAFGGPPGALLGRRMTDLVMLQRPDGTADRRVALGQRIERIGIRLDGTTFPVEATVTKVDLPGDPLYAICIRDLTEGRRVSEQLAKTEHLLQAILDMSPALIYIKDLGGRYLLANKEFEKAVGKPRGEIVGRSDDDLWPTELAASHQADDLSVVTHRTAVQVEEQAVRSDGLHTYLSVKFPLLDADGSVYATAGISSDITERQHLEERLNQVRRMDSLGQLAGGIAHDFNNLLSVILNYASFVEEVTLGNDAARADLEQIKSAAERGARLTKQLLIFGRRNPVAPELVDLNQVVTDVAALLSRTIGEHICLIVDAEDGLPSVRIDRGQMDQLIVNLAVNARDAMPGGGTMLIRTHAERLDGEPFVELSVSDTGTGMSPSVTAHVFEPFFSTKHDGDGTGLGLATVYGIVTNAGGRIDVESVEGRGTTFRVHLPAFAPARTPSLAV